MPELVHRPLVAAIRTTIQGSHSDQSGQGRELASLPSLMSWEEREPDW